jgi:DNA-directed RNA polymerase specialized sigma24 family protein
MEAAAATFARPDGPAAWIRTGDRDAFVSLYGPDFDGLFDFALRSVRDRASAAAALSDALHRAWDIFRGRGAPYDVRRWLFVIARDAVLAQPRRRTQDVQEREGLVYTALEGERLSDPSLAFDRESIELVWDTATALGREDYSLLDLHLRRDLSVDELAEQLEEARDDVAWDLSRLCDWFDSTVRLTLLATRSRHNCAGLDGDLSANGASIERVAGRHVRECASCRETSARFASATEIFASFAPMPPPSGLREQTAGLFLREPRRRRRKLR